MCLSIFSFRVTRGSAVLLFSKGGQGTRHLLSRRFLWRDLQPALPSRAFDLIMPVSGFSLYVTVVELFIPENLT